MLASLRNRIVGLVALLSIAALALGGGLLGTDRQSRGAYAWVNHTQEVIISLDTVAGSLREAESGLRGYLLTGSSDYLGPFDQDLVQARALAAHVRMLVADNLPQERRAAVLQSLVAAKSASMAHSVAVARSEGVKRAIDPAARARGKAIMDRLVGLTTTMRQTERDLLAIRTRAADERAALTRNLLLVGWPTLALLFAGAGWIVLRSVNRPIADLLDAVGRLGGGDREARVLVEGRTIEFQRLSRAYNDMADNLATAIDRHAAAEQEIARANAELSRRGQPSRARHDRGRSDRSRVMFL